MRNPSLWLAFVVLLLPSQPIHAQDELGRLFFTPAQRSSLDAGKYIMGERKTAQRPRKPRGPQRYAVDGVVTRSDGVRSVWLNGKAYHDRSPPGTRITVHPEKPDAVVLKPGGKKPVEIKVSQEFDRTSGVVRERYEISPSGTRPNTPGTTSAAASSATEKPGQRSEE